VSGPGRELSGPGGVTGPGRALSDQLRTVFERESRAVIEQRVESAKQALTRDSHVTEQYYTHVIDIPVRPRWSYEEDKSSLEQRERSYFKQWLAEIYRRYPVERLNYFEHNLEVWRQLWRVTELSDVLLMLVDVRHPLVHFSPALYHHVTHRLHKHVIVVLTKCDLVTAEHVDKWRNYFARHVPDLRVVAFSSYRTDPVIDEEKKRQKRKLKYNPDGVEELWHMIDSLQIRKGDHVMNLGAEARAQSRDNEEFEEDSSDEESAPVPQESRDESEEHVTQHSHVTLGLIGHPNVGKSTLINALKGRKVCSTSRTPGHTKWRQTIYLTPQLMLCDCPGLVFPYLDMPKPLQVLCGIYPLAQLREPYSALHYLMTRVRVEQLYQLQPLNNEPWSGYHLAQAYAHKRGYMTKGGNYDTHRAGLELLREVLDGRVLLALSADTAALDLAAAVASLAKPVEESKLNIEPEIKDEDSESESEEQESSSASEESDEPLTNVSNRFAAFDLE
jgi:ribosome biogenesis GTPase A